MKAWLMEGLARLLCFIRSEWEEERGEANMIAIILIVIAVIALAAIFRDELIGIVTGLFEQIKDALGM